MNRCGDAGSCTIRESDKFRRPFSARMQQENFGEDAVVAERFCAKGMIGTMPSRSHKSRPGGTVGAQLAKADAEESSASAASANSRTTGARQSARAKSSPMPASASAPKQSQQEIAHVREYDEAVLRTMRADFPNVRADSSGIRVRGNRDWPDHRAQSGAANGRRNRIRVGAWPGQHVLDSVTKRIALAIRRVSSSYFTAPQQRVEW